MSKQEFELLVGQWVDNKEYELIEKVYTCHPSISEVDGKKQIAGLYLRYGMVVIKDMEKRADKIIELEKLKHNPNYLQLDIIKEVIAVESWLYDFSRKISKVQSVCGKNE